jgi:hypothetical protein
MGVLRRQLWLDKSLGTTQAENRRARLGRSRYPPTGLYQPRSLSRVLGCVRSVSWFTSRLLGGGLVNAVPRATRAGSDPPAAFRSY